MHKVVSENKLPIIVSCVALVIAVFVGLIPVWQQNARDSAARAPGTVALVDLASLEARISELEAQVAAQGNTQDTAQAEAPAPTAPAVDPALRAEIDLITKGLVNQTGRVSRLKAEVAALKEVAGQTPPRVSDEISLAKRGLSNLTRRVNAMQGSLVPLASAPRAIDRLGLQMSNVERAVTRLNIKLNTMSQTAAPQTAALQNDTAEDLSQIAAQLETLLQKLSAN